MSEEWLSVEQVADRLGLHVRTVRAYIRHGKLPAVRIGKQYRISPADLATFTGRPGADRSAPGDPAAATTGPRIEASTVIDVDGISQEAADRLATLLVAGAQLSRGLQLRTIHDERRRRLKVIVLGDPAATAEVLRTLDEIVEGILHG